MEGFSGDPMPPEGQLKVPLLPGGLQELGEVADKGGGGRGAGGPGCAQGELTDAGGRDRRGQASTPLHGGEGRIYSG